MFIEQPPQFVRQLYPGACWRMNVSERAVYLTFDDGPIPEVTPWVLDVLDRYRIKATFFMVGDNVRKHPEEYRMVVERGHRIGNHTYHHLKGLGVSADSYVANVEEANRLVESDLFRPPHGLMRMSQYHALRERYRIVMWDLVTRDYNPKLTGDEVLGKVKRYARNGSIITFHDSLRATHNLYYALPRAIEWLLAEGYEFKIFE
jgi:peptidoglycan/xylan/chitin deacetylase (PgdA/CDA1 family)